MEQLEFELFGLIERWRLRGGDFKRAADELEAYISDQIDPEDRDDYLEEKFQEEQADYAQELRSQD